MNISPAQAEELLKEVPQPTEPAFIILWMWFPNFIANDLQMHKRLLVALEERWRGAIPVDLDMESDLAREIHEWICQWVADQYPLYDCLNTWLQAMDTVRQG